MSQENVKIKEMRTAVEDVFDRCEWQEVPDNENKYQPLLSRGRVGIPQVFVGISYFDWGINVSFLDSYCLNQTNNILFYGSVLDQFENLIKALTKVNEWQLILSMRVTKQKGDGSQNYFTLE